MIHLFRLLGDYLHAASILVILVIVGSKGNGFGISLKSHYLYLAVFCLRYLDLFQAFYSTYNFMMKLYFIATTTGVIYFLTRVEPAKSTYSPVQDSVNHWTLLFGAATAGLVIHLVGSGVVDIKGSSGQEFEVHLQHYSWLSFFWTWSICLEPLAMIPQLYIFRKNRRITWDVRLAIALKGAYRISYICFWLFRAQRVSESEHHYLLYISGGLQCLTYYDFWLYHFSVATLWFLSKCGGSDSSSLIEDSGVGQWASRSLARQNPLDMEMQSLTGDSYAARKPTRTLAKHGLGAQKVGKIGII